MAKGAMLVAVEALSRQLNKQTICDIVSDALDRWVDLHVSNESFNDSMDISQ